MTSTDDRLAAVEQRIALLEDHNAVRKLQHAYGYYIDKCLYNQVVELFTEDCKIYFHGGVFKGKDGARRLYIERFQKAFVGGRNGPVFGFLLDHPVMQDIVDVAEDRKTAKARMRCLMQAGTHDLLVRDKPARPGALRQWWEGGIYENTYARGADGKWRISELQYRALWHANFEDGWAHTKPLFVPFLGKTLSEGDPLGPDELYEDKWVRFIIRSWYWIVQVDVAAHGHCYFTAALARHAHGAVPLPAPDHGRVGHRGGDARPAQA